ncbi:MAG: hypothetical protein DWQ35_00755 [Planctomycetota bacterium]|nr:MAG: hypothetical protein DWQ35_00755 [Planctomycetota bacterium]REK29861.1 MAG: hypothetical protein DWQ42_02875 [Planctomycetota bacterium]
MVADVAAYGPVVVAFHVNAPKAVDRDSAGPDESRETANVRRAATDDAAAPPRGGPVAIAFHVNAPSKAVGCDSAGPGGLRGTASAHDSTNSPAADVTTDSGPSPAAGAEAVSATARRIARKTRAIGIGPATWLAASARRMALPPTLPRRMSGHLSDRREAAWRPQSRGPAG